MVVYIDKYRAYNTKYHLTNNYEVRESLIVLYMCMRILYRQDFVIANTQVVIIV